MEQTQISLFLQPGLESLTTIEWLTSISGVASSSVSSSGDSSVTGSITVLVRRDDLEQNIIRRNVAAVKNLLQREKRRNYSFCRTSSISSDFRYLLKFRMPNRFNLCFNFSTVNFWSSLGGKKRGIGKYI